MIENLVVYMKLILRLLRDRRVSPLLKIIPLIHGAVFRYSRPHPAALRAG